LASQIVSFSDQVAAQACALIPKDGAADACLFVVPLHSVVLPREDGATALRQQHHAFTRSHEVRVPAFAKRLHLFAGRVVATIEGEGTSIITSNAQPITVDHELDISLRISIKQHVDPIWRRHSRAAVTQHDYDGTDLALAKRRLADRAEMPSIPIGGVDADLNLGRHFGTYL